jgi:hypothetical protein
MWQLIAAVVCLSWSAASWACDCPDRFSHFVWADHVLVVDNVFVPPLEVTSADGIDLEVAVEELGDVQIIKPAQPWPIGYITLTDGNRQQQFIAYEREAQPPTNEPPNLIPYAYGQVAKACGLDVERLIRFGFESDPRFTTFVFDVEGHGIFGGDVLGRGECYSSAIEIDFGDVLRARAAGINFDGSVTAWGEPFDMVMPSDDDGDGVDDVTDECPDEAGDSSFLTNRLGCPNNNGVGEGEGEPGEGEGESDASGCTSSGACAPLVLLARRRKRST